MDVCTYVRICVGIRCIRYTGSEVLILKHPTCTKRKPIPSQRSWTTWNHWAITVPGVDNTGDNSVGLKMWKNGELFAEGINGWAVGDHNGFFLGTFPNYNIKDFHYRGYIDNLRVWSGVRTQAQLKETMYTSVLNDSHKASLKGSWDFDEAHRTFNNLDMMTGSDQDSLVFDFVDESLPSSVSTMEDGSGNGNHLELAGCVPPQAPYCVEGYKYVQNMCGYFGLCIGDIEAADLSHKLFVLL
jgi:hypothetical protein